MKYWIERLRSRTGAFAHDLLMVPVAWLLAYWTRFNLEAIPPEFLATALQMLPLVLLCCGALYWVFGLYRGVWRFASLRDLIRIIQAVTAATVLTLVVLFVVNRTENVPRSVLPLFLLYQLVLLGGPRLLYRWLKDHRLALRPGLRVLVVGASSAGEMLVRDMVRDRTHTYNPVAFVDDRLRRQGGAIHGVPIAGTTHDLETLVTTLEIDLVMLALPAASAAQMQAIVERCEASGKPFRTLPRFGDLLSGQVTLRQLRQVCIEDLLGRTPVQLDWEAIRAGLADRVVLITGAGGSIGAELCRQVIGAGGRRLLLVDNSEFNLYRLEGELRAHQPDLDFACHLLDVGDRVAIEALFARERPQIVFHAAAYKHVPLLEGQVRAAVRNNVFGTQVVARAAGRCGCERFVLISTDKAVNPANVMGATKRIAERLCQDLATRADTRYIIVRFGNVLGSAGSVVPLFHRQIEQGGPVTVTHPQIERFFMTIPEACQLIMQAAVIGAGGEIFVLDMGEPIKIAYLAEQMIRLAGREPGQDIAIEYIGLRPGEKLSEELFYAAEDLMPTRHPKIRVAHREPAASAHIGAGLAALQASLEDCDQAAIRARLQALVPQWQTPGATTPSTVPTARSAATMAAASDD